MSKLLSFLMLLSMSLSCNYICIILSWIIALLLLDIFSKDLLTVCQLNGCQCDTEKPLN